MYALTWSAWEMPAGVPIWAAGVGAPHLRQRAFWVAHSEGTEQPWSIDSKGTACGMWLN